MPKPRRNARMEDNVIAMCIVFGYPVVIVVVGLAIDWAIHGWLKQGR